MINLKAQNWEIQNINAVIFDKDGTFLNDNMYWGKLAEKRIQKIIEYFELDKNLFEELCFAIGHNSKTCKLIKNGPIGIMSRNQVIEFMVNELTKYNVKTNFNTIEQIFQDVHTKFTDEMEKYIDFLPYSEGFIRKLKSLGIKLCVVTSDTYSHTVKTLGILGIDDCFDCVIGKDNSTQDKKSGEPALIALKKINAQQNETIVIGDALMDYFMSVNANLKGHILVATGQTDIEILKEHSKFVVNDLSEVYIENAI